MMSSSGRNALSRATPCIKRQLSNNKTAHLWLPFAHETVASSFVVIFTVAVDKVHVSVKRLVLKREMVLKGISIIKVRRSPKRCPILKWKKEWIRCWMYLNIYMPQQLCCTTIKLLFTPLRKSYFNLTSFGSYIDIKKEHEILNFHA